MIALVVVLTLFVLLDVAALRWGVNSRDDRPEAVTAESRSGTVLV